MKIELDVLDLGAAQTSALPLCFHTIHTKRVYSRSEKEAMELTSERYGAVEIFARGSRKPISKPFAFGPIDDDA